MDALLLSRIQFGLTTAFHIIFPTLTIGLGLYLVVIEFLWLRTKKEIYYRLYRFWVKIFAIHFAVGVVSGITLEFEFGTNWAIFSQRVANVMGPMLAYEAMTAFFLEAGFLGIMLFGWNRVPPVLHFISTCLVAAGANLSAVWIMAANAWMQTPAGYEIVEGQFHLTSFKEALFNPAFPTHLIHMLLASYTTTAFAVAGISAWFLLKRRNEDFFRLSLKLALIMALIAAPLQVVVGDLKGQSVATHQPAKLAAMEAHWETNIEGGAAFIVIALPDPTNERNRIEIRIPALLSWLITHSADGQIAGLKDFPREDRPNIIVTFWTFRFMVAIGFLYLGIAIWTAVLWYRRRLWHSRTYFKALVAVQPLGFAATILGWITAEMGRQPWLVYGLMRTSEGVSPIVAGNVVWSLIMFTLFFGLIGAAYFFYTLKALKRGPDMDSPIPTVQMPGSLHPKEARR
jgi:cytochrome bd ubiquinol oxidase subunit I